MKQKIAATIVCLISSFITNAQSKAGIDFEQGLNWQQVKEKARAENKLIFVDCFATWCLPCKEMENHIFSDDKIGRYFNDNFISIRVQMDSTNQDNELIQRWYADSHAIQRQYGIIALPSFLFFSPEGNIVHKGVGFMNLDDFILLGSNALNLNKQYYTLLKNYLEGKRDYESMPYLSTTARSLGDKAMATDIARVYKENYMDSLDRERLCTKENIELMEWNPQLIHSNDNFFYLIYRCPKMVDSTMNDDQLSKRIVDFIIMQEEVNSKIWLHDKPAVKDPNWSDIKLKITQKYNSKYAERIVIDAKISWYSYKKVWKEYCKSVIDKVQKYGPYGPLDTNTNLNENAWDLFEHSFDKSELTKALSWIERAIKSNTQPNGEYFDTYSNLLYKLGRINEAMIWEKKAVAISPLSKDIRDNFDKMKKGYPTWPSKSGKL